MVALLKDYTDKAFNLANLIEYVFASRKIAPGLQETRPTAEMLRGWSQDLLPSMQEYFDSAGLLERSKSTFAQAASKDLQAQTISCFQEVGDMVSNVHSHGLTSLDALAASMAAPLNLEPQTKLTLPERGDWALPLGHFFEAHLSVN